MLVVVVLDCVDPEGLAQFGCRRWVIASSRCRSRMHIDLHVDDLDGQVARLVELGATRHGGELGEAGFRWVVLADPEGNEFCVVGRSGKRS